MRRQHRGVSSEPATDSLNTFVEYLQMRLYRAAVILLAGCAQATPSPDPAPVSRPAPVPVPPVTVARTDTFSLSIRWFRVSAEQHAAYLETFRAAGDRLPQRVNGMSANTWAVILDADETVLDNSQNEVERARLGIGFSNYNWNEWVKRREATATPGSVGFVERVRSLGGRVVIVTNRDEVVCNETRENLQKVGIRADLVLCKPTGASSDKNPRFDAVQNGSTSLPALHVVMWIGDNIQDFPHLTQDLRSERESAFARFGDEFWLLPNPMYGSWDRNPVK